MYIKSARFILRSVLLSIVTLSIFADYENRDSVKGFVNEVAKTDSTRNSSLISLNK